MKKLLTIIASLGMASTALTSVVACSSSPSDFIKTPVNLQSIITDSYIDTINVDDTQESKLPTDSDIINSINKYNKKANFSLLDLNDLEILNKTNTSAVISAKKDSLNYVGEVEVHYYVNAVDPIYQYITNTNLGDIQIINSGTSYDVAKVLLEKNINLEKLGIEINHLNIEIDENNHKATVSHPDLYGSVIVTFNFEVMLNFDDYISTYNLGNIYTEQEKPSDSELIEAVLNKNYNFAEYIQMTNSKQYINIEYYGENTITLSHPYFLGSIEFNYKSTQIQQLSNIITDNNLGDIGWFFKNYSLLEANIKSAIWEKLKEIYDIDTDFIKLNLDSNLDQSGCNSVEIIGNGIYSGSITVNFTFNWANQDDVIKNLGDITIKSSSTDFEKKL